MSAPTKTAQNGHTLLETVGEWEVWRRDVPEEDRHQLAHGVWMDVEAWYDVVHGPTGKLESSWVIFMRACQQAQGLAGVPETPILPPLQK